MGVISFHLSKTHILKIVAPLLESFENAMHKHLYISKYSIWVHLLVCFCLTPKISQVKVHFLLEKVDGFKKNITVQLIFI